MQNHPAASISPLSTAPLLERTVMMKFRLALRERLLRTTFDFFESDPVGEKIDAVRQRHQSVNDGKRGIEQIATIPCHRLAGHNDTGRENPVVQVKKHIWLSSAACHP